VTGDAVILVARRMIREWKDSSADEINRMVREFVEGQILRPESLPEKTFQPPKTGKTGRVLRALLDTVSACREGI
jgi:hypothetical protein